MASPTPKTPTAARTPPSPPTTTAVMDAAIEGLSGALGAVLSLTLTYPLLTVSTLRAVEQQQQQQQQQPQPQPPPSSSAAATAATAASSLLLGPVRDVKDHAARFGWKSLFAGLQPAVAATAVSQGIYFSAYAALRRAAVAHRLRNNKGLDAAAAAQLSVGASILVASAAGCINVLLTNPWWVVVTTMQARAGDERQPVVAAAAEEKEQSSASGKVAAARAPARPGSSSSSVAAAAAPPPQQQGGGALSVAQAIWRERGWRGFCAGLAPSLVMVLNPTINYVLYEALVARWAAVRLERRRLRGGANAARGAARSALASAVPPAAALSAAEVFLLSALAKVGSTLATYPLLVVKSRLQAVRASGNGGATTVAPPSISSNGVVAAARLLMREEGAAGFYRGLRVKLLQTVLAAAVLMSTKETLAARTRRSVLALALLVASAGGGGALR